MNEQPPFLNWFIGNLMKTIGLIWAVLSGTCFTISVLFGLPIIGPSLSANLWWLLGSVGVGAALWFVGGLITGKPND